MARKRTATKNILQEVVNLLVFTVQISSITDNLDGTYTLTTCQTYHLQPSFTIAIDEVEYVIESVEKDVNIVVTGPSLPGATSFLCYTPKFYYGTPIQASAELTEIVLAKDKTPMIFKSEADGDFSERYFGEDSPKDREAKLRIFFLTQSNPEDWTSSVYHSDAFEPMTALAMEFVERLRLDKRIGDIGEYTLENRSRVGVSTRGDNKRQFASANLSGVEMNITVPILTEDCITPCTIIVIPPGITWEDMILPYESYTSPWEDYA